jgi:hypothetical protein
MHVFFLVPGAPYKTIYLLLSLFTHLPPPYYTKSPRRGRRWKAEICKIHASARACFLLLPRTSCLPFCCSPLRIYSFNLFFYYIYNHPGTFTTTEEMRKIKRSDSLDSSCVLLLLSKPIVQHIHASHSPLSPLYLLLPPFIQNLIDTYRYEAKETRNEKLRDGQFTCLVLLLKPTRNTTYVSLLSVYFISHTLLSTMCCVENRFRQYHDWKLLGEIQNNEAHDTYVSSENLKPELYDSVLSAFSLSHTSCVSES